MEWFCPRVSSSRFSAAVLVMAVLAGCGSGGSSNPCPVGRYASEQGAPDTPQKMHVHANGLQLSVSETCQVRTTPMGFVVEPFNNADHRYPFYVSIQLLTTRPESTGYRVRYLGSGRILWYSATHGEGAGSGDPAWEIIAVEHVSNRWIQYRESKQEEWQPRELWKVARGLRYDGHL